MLALGVFVLVRRGSLVLRQAGRVDMGSRRRREAHRGCVFSGHRGIGLLAEYFGDTYFNESAAPARIDPRPSANFGETSSTLPVSLCRATPGSGARCQDLLSVRWTGYLHPTVDGTYGFEAVGDGIVRVWLDGQLIIESNGFTRTRSIGQSSMPLSSAQLYELRIEFSRQKPVIEGSPIKDTFSLLWATEGLPQEQIPTRALYPARVP